MPAAATDGLIRKLPPANTKGSTGSTASASVAAASEAAMMPPIPADRSADIKRLRASFGKKAQHYRSLFWSTNCYFQSPANDKKLDFWKKLLGEEASQLLELNAADIKAERKKIAKKPISVSQKRHEMALATSKVNSVRTTEYDGDRRMVGNCIGISSAMYADLIVEYKGVTGVTISIFTFDGLDLDSDLGAHAFIVIECDGEAYILDGWRGDGIAQGPFFWNRNTNWMNQMYSGVKVDSYYDRKLSVHLSSKM